MASDGRSTRSSNVGWSLDHIFHRFGALRGEIVVTCGCGMEASVARSERHQRVVLPVHSDAVGGIPPHGASLHRIIACPIERDIGVSGFQAHV